MAEHDDLWIFAYGSLMWRPDFVFAAAHRARLNGYHRALCIFSNHYRGTPDKPGLVLGLDRGGSCVGLAFRIAAAMRDATLAAVRARELVTNVYHEVEVEVLLPDGNRVRAVTFVANRDHRQYAGKLGHDTMLAHVRTCAGLAGPNVDYVRNTDAHLRQLGVVDHRLAVLIAAIDGPVSRGSDVP